MVDMQGMFVRSILPNMKSTPLRSYSEIKWRWELVLMLMMTLLMVIHRQSRLSKKVAIADSGVPLGHRQVSNMLDGVP
jgi:hypothetical protein